MGIQQEEIKGSVKDKKTWYSTREITGIISVKETEGSDRRTRTGKRDYTASA